MAAFTVAEVAAACGGRVAGDADARLTGVRALESAGPDALSFVSDAKALKRAASSGAGAFLARSAAELPGRTVVEVPDPQLALIAVLRLFHPRRAARPGIHPSAAVDAAAHVDPSAEIGPWAVIGPGARRRPARSSSRTPSSARTAAWAPEPGSTHVVLYDRVVLGARVEIQRHRARRRWLRLCDDAAGLLKIPQVGIVTVGDDVEIRANMR